MADDAPNPRIFEGANNPPAPDPFGAIKADCDDLYAEAAPWLTGAPITTDEQAEEVDDLLRRARQAYEAAESQRLTEVAPLDEAKKAIQAKFHPLIGDTKAGKGSMIRLQEACKALLTPWRAKKAAAAAAAAEAARQEAQKQAAAAAQAARDASGDLEAAEAAEALLREAAQAQREAGRATKAATTGTGLRTTYVAVMTDRKAAVLHYMNRFQDDFLALTQRLADTDVRNGLRTIPGFDVKPEQRAV
jgi:hypothetical protein